MPGNDVDPQQRQSVSPTSPNRRLQTPVVVFNKDGKQDRNKHTKSSVVFERMEELGSPYAKAPNTVLSFFKASYETE